MYGEITREGIGKEKKVVTKQVAPDVLTINSWLNNRRRDQWSSNPKPAIGLTHDQLTRLRVLIYQAMEEEV